MEIQSGIVIDLVKGQGRVEQALIDLTKRLDVALPAIVKEQKDVVLRVDKVENRVWYLSGLGTAFGIAVGHAINYFKK